MIKATELRIGNLIHIGWDDVEVTAIEDDGTLDTTAYFDGFKGCCGCMDSEAKPIPLTEEWLQRMGFEDTNGGYRATGAEVVYSIKTAGRPIRLWWDYPDKWVFETWNDLNLQYVHQLQNLFFALCGEELTVKL